MSILSSLSTQALFGQLLIGLINGAFYAMLSLGMAVIFGLLNIVNFAHGAFYMLGAFCALLLLDTFGLNYWVALIAAPMIVGLFGMVTERLLLRRIYDLDHAYGMLLTFGITLVLEGVFRQRYGVAGLPYDMPGALQGGHNLGIMYLPNYRAWVLMAAIAVCLSTWLIIEKTRLGSYLRAATENAPIVQAFGVNVPLLITLTYGAGIALAAFAGVMAAPIYQVSPLMGSNIIITVFAIVVIGGMGSIFGAILTGFALGVIEGLTKVFYSEASSTIIFVIMVVVLLLKPAGLFGKTEISTRNPAIANHESSVDFGSGRVNAMAFGFLFAVLATAPYVGIYPVFLMKAMCFALFASAFNLLFGFAGLLSFGHAAFFGSAGYLTAYALKDWGWNPEFALALGTAFAAVLGFFFGWVSIRRQGIYFAMITLALAQMVFFVALQSEFTGGENGITSVPRGRLFGFIDLNDATSMYFFVLAVFAIGVAIIYRAIRSPFGFVLKSIRENEARAISLGYNTDRYKLLAFVISAALSGLAGGVKVLIFQLVTLADVHWATSGDVVLMTIVGGLGTIFGPVVGAFVIVTLEHQLVELGSLVTIVQGIVFIICVLAFRRGIISKVAQWIVRARGYAGSVPDSRPADAQSMHNRSDEMLVRGSIPQTTSQPPKSGFHLP